MQNADLNYRIKINTGEFKGQTIDLETELEELEESSISELLVERGFLDGWCNDDEYEIISREIIVYDE